jgi:hypothetical protein
MRFVWNLVSFLAVVNLLALLMVGAWLWHSKRLDRERIHAVRELLSTTIPAEQEAAEKARQQAAAEQAAQAEAELAANPRLGSAERIQEVVREHQQTSVVSQRLEDENRLLSMQLKSQQEELQQREAQLAAQQQQWERSIESDKSRKNDAQFAKAVKLLESIPAKQGKQKLQELVAAGSTEQAVAYLNAMNPRAAAKILREFKTDAENKLATELLERFRTFGLPAGAADDAAKPSDADTANSTAGAPQQPVAAAN